MDEFVLTKRTRKANLFPLVSSLVFDCYLIWHYGKNTSPSGHFILKQQNCQKPVLLYLVLDFISSTSAAYITYSLQLILGILFLIFSFNILFSYSGTQFCSCLNLPQPYGFSFNCHASFILDTVSSKSYSVLTAVRYNSAIWFPLLYSHSNLMSGSFSGKWIPYNCFASFKKPWWKTWTWECHPVKITTSAVEPGVFPVLKFSTAEKCYTYKMELHRKYSVCSREPYHPWNTK